MSTGKEETPLFSDPRWNDTSIPVVVGHEEVTEEEKKRATELLDRMHERKRNKEQV